MYNEVSINVPNRKLPCNLDHNGECLVCDAWLRDCDWISLWNGNFSYYTLDELIDKFKNYLTEEEKQILRSKYENPICGIYRKELE